MGAIIWQKKTTMNTTGGATVMGSYPFPRNGIIEIDYEFILIFKKRGKAPKVDRSIKEQSRISKEKWKEYFSGHWYFNGARQDNHIAMFPVELPKRAIEMFTFVGETVLDPFLGSGTTSLAALMTNRNSIGYEINKNFLPVIKQKLNVEEKSLFFDFYVKEQKKQKVNWEHELKKSKYIFSDPVYFDKKVDPNKLKFGSKISVRDNSTGMQREKYYTVKEILNTNLIKLNNDLVVRLIGIKPENDKLNAAKKFLSNKILKRQIYLQFDDQKYDKNNQLMAYVYMKNKTFINAHILKHGFGSLDTEYDFKYRNKFQNLIEENVTNEKTN